MRDMKRTEGSEQELLGTSDTRKIDRSKTTGIL